MTFSSLCLGNFCSYVFRSCLSITTKIKLLYVCVNDRRKMRQIEISQVIFQSAAPCQKWSTIYEWVQGISKLSVTFIRSLKSCFFLEKPLIEMAAHLIPLCAQP